jgi:PLP dependent protein
MVVSKLAGMRDSILRVKDRIVQACNRAGRSPDGVKLVAVSKNVDAGRIREAASFGIADFGENYIQEAREKIGANEGGLCWHMIGHIQRNKIKYVPGLFSWVHSVDRVEVLEGLERYGEELKVLFEMNLSGEESKHGAGPDEVRRMLERTVGLRFVKPMGLMTMAPFSDDPEESRRIFATLRQTLESLNKEFFLTMKDLSMGMSSDFDVAIEEGSTMVRVGTAIFGERVYGP